ncbi:hypothetical protein NQZ68_001722 [Dissostichus eleginoides]|nr:hypothetical protein NQZ68_001722 [Dissostichus eleginoides]
MFGAGPCRICPFDETTHRPGRAVPSAGTIKQPLDNGDNGEHSERHRHPRSHSRPTHFHLSIRTTPSPLLLPVAAAPLAARRGDASSPSVVHRKHTVTSIAVAFVGGRAPPIYSDWTTGLGVRGSRWELYFDEASPSRARLGCRDYNSHNASVRQ